MQVDHIGKGFICYYKKIEAHRKEDADAVRSAFFEIETLSAKHSIPKYLEKLLAHIKRDF